MKRLILSLAAIAILGLPKGMAQIINPGFETWTANLLVPTAMDPNSGNGSTGWWDFNVLNSALLGSSPVTVFQDNANPSPHSGNYCAKIISATMTSSSYTTLKSYGFNYPQTNGLIVTGTINAGLSTTIKTGIPINNKWGTFSFYYRYIPNGSDTCSCTVLIYHWNSVKKNRSLVGIGVWDTGATITSWKQATVKINYDSTNVVPDTAFIVFSAASLYNNPQDNDTMNLDDASYTTVTGINSIYLANADVNIYPNPADNELNIKVTGTMEVNHAEIYDITGKLVNTYSMHNNFLSINTQTYNSGLYFYKLFDHAGAQVSVGKFSVVR